MQYNIIMMTRNRNLINAKIRKNDEFYTLTTDIENELKHYQKYFTGKVVYCNCDTLSSNFWQYFKQNFDILKLKKLVITGLKKPTDKYAYAFIYDGKNIKKSIIADNGSFTDTNCVKLMQDADIVVTNPPFSKINQYIKLLIDNNKRFLFIGSKNWITYKAFFPLFMTNQIRLGYNSIKEFEQPDGTFKQFGNICWFTNLPVDKNKKDAQLKLFEADNYFVYDNYPAFEINKLASIFVDNQVTIEIDKWKLANWYQLYGQDVQVLCNKRNTVVISVNYPLMGVPVTFMEKWQTQYSEFEILGCSKFKGEFGSNYLGIHHISDKWLNAYFEQGNHGHYSTSMNDPVYFDKAGNAKPTYIRIFIRKRN